MTIQISCLFVIPAEAGIQNFNTFCNVDINILIRLLILMLNNPGNIVIEYKNHQHNQDKHPHLLGHFSLF